MGPRRTLPQFFAENDVAAVRYGPADDPDVLLEDFLYRRLGEGHDALGLLQRHVAGARRRNRSVAFELAPREAWPESGTARPPRNAPCSAVLPELAARLAQALDRQPDIVVLNRFGRAECEGKGLLGALAEALDRDIPVLIATPVGLYDRWTSVSCGLAVTLSPQAASLEAWWRALGHGVSDRPSHASFCERAK